MTVLLLYIYDTTAMYAMSAAEEVETLKYAVDFAAKRIKEYENKLTASQATIKELKIDLTKQRQAYIQYVNGLNSEIERLRSEIERLNTTINEYIIIFEMQEVQLSQQQATIDSQLTQGNGSYKL